MTTTTTLGDAVKLTYSDEQDLPSLRPWFNVIRRLRRAVGTNGFSVVRIAVVCNDGDPVNWTEPRATAIEPKADAQTLEALLFVLSE